MLLEEIRIVQIGCGISGDIAGGILMRLGAHVTKLVFRPCPACGDRCDGDEAWRAHYSTAKQLRVVDLATDPRAWVSENEQPDAALADGLPLSLVTEWSRYAGEREIPTVLFGDVDGPGFDAVVETCGLIAEAVTGVAGTMGPSSGAPTPFGFLFGETNCAVRAAGMIVDRLLADARHPGRPPDDLMMLVSAADACLDAMDNPWQEYSLSGPVHEAPNSLTNTNYRRTGPQKAGLVPYGLFEAIDGWVCLVGAGTTAVLAESLKRPDLLTDPRFASIEARVANREFVVPLLQEWIHTFDSGDSFVDFLGDRAVVARSRRLDEILPDDEDLLGFDNVSAPYRVRSTIQS